MSPENHQALSCFLIGGDSLLIECGEVLLARGHDLRGVITSAAPVMAWARSRNLQVLDVTNDYAAELAQRPFDYLFSITHLALIPDAVLKLASKGAINFHDGPLPRYAGLNTPAWALMRGESEYGITWHKINGGVDEGDILLQRTFTISPHETALSLNTRCFEAGLETFGELADQLAAGEARPVPQDLSLRNYFGRHDLPEAAGVLDWTRPAHELDALIRALDFGRYLNPLTTAKICHDDAALIVLRSELVDRAGRTGTLLDAGDSGLTIATSSGAIRLTAFATLAGKTLTPELALARLGVRMGESFRGPDAAGRAGLTSLVAQTCRHEAAWTRRLLQLDPLTLPWPTSISQLGASGHESLDVALPPRLASMDASEFAAAAIGAFGLVLARFCGRRELTVGFGHDELLLEDGPSLHAARSLLSLPVQPEHNFAALRAAVRDELERSRNAGTWARDLFARQPALHGRTETFEPGGLDIAIELRRDSRAFQPSASDLLTLVVDTSNRSLRLCYDRTRLSRAAANTLQGALEVLLTNLTARPEIQVGQHDLLPKYQSHQILEDWNATTTEVQRGLCVHELIEAQARRTPTRTAVVFEDQEISYAELELRSGALAARLTSLGAGPDTLVGVCVERSIDLIVSVLGVLRAGAAYVPLDHTLPKERSAYMAEDARLGLVVTQRALRPQLALPTGTVVVDVDEPLPAPAQGSASPRRARPEDLAYVLYTSGSTGRPKGVMVEHRNVLNFFAGMDARIPHDPPGRWLAVTNLSFDISVLELLWPLTHGFEVVIYKDQERADGAAAASTQSPMDFGLYLWGSDAGQGPRKYELMLEAARFGDEHGFSSIWTPERHFHAFGGPYPNPSVTSAAIAAVTHRIQIRAGSCVSPLHHPIRIAEEWAVVDNLSNGRVGISFAAGWQPDDFVLRPENLADNKGQMLRDVETVRRLWRGESIEFPGPDGSSIARVTLPRPVQKELPVWITSAGNPETYRLAGEAGANVLTHLLGQSVEEVAEKIRIYRQARAAAGFDASTGIVTLMLHTFIGDDIEKIRETVREPMKRYLASATNLVKKYAWSFPAFKRPATTQPDLDEIDLDSLSETELDAMMEHAFQRYFETSGLFGTPESVQPMIDELKRIGVNEIGCLIDFGVANELTLKHLVHLDRARQLANPAALKASLGSSLQQQVQRRRISHMQCTPSMARMLLLDAENRAAFGSLEQLLIGGETFSAALARELSAVTSARITNMYGPTETTVWSSTHAVDPADATIPIGRAIANTQLYVLDIHRRPLPPGVPGDLYIGGAGVVRGYLNRPELSAERFVTNPFRSGERMYATGDVARFREDGALEFLGRSDHQVKIRGYRVELGEIEARLGEHPAVRECVVAASHDQTGEPRLVAYLTINGAAPEPATLREYLRARLPEYMLPAHFIVLHELPLTPNAKVDRKALPAPESLRANARSAPTADLIPQGEIQSKIAACWRQVLGLEQVGARENFFDIGGHSLLVVRLQRLLKEALGRPLALTDLYRFPTIQSLANWLESDGEDATLAQSANRAEQRRASLQKRRLRGT